MRRYEVGSDGGDFERCVAASCQGMSSNQDGPHAATVRIAWRSYFAHPSILNWSPAWLAAQSIRCSVARANQVQTGLRVCELTALTSRDVHLRLAERQLSRHGTIAQDLRLYCVCGGSVM